MVHHENIVRGIDGDPSRAIQLPVSGPGFTPVGQVLPGRAARGIVDSHPVVVLVGDVKMPSAVQRHGHGPNELSVAGAVTAPKLSQVVFVQVTDADAYRGGAQRVATVQHEDPAVTADCDVVGIGEATATEAVVHDADGLDVVQHDSGRFGLRAHANPLS